LRSDNNVTNNKTKIQYNAIGSSQYQTKHLRLNQEDTIDTVTYIIYEKAKFGTI